MNRSLGVMGTSFIGLGLVAIILLPARCMVSVKGMQLPGPFNLFDEDAVLFHPASGENKLVSEAAALKAALEATKANQQSAHGGLIEYSGYDYIQYFPAGSENKLAKETEALKAARTAAKAAQRQER